MNFNNFNNILEKLFKSTKKSLKVTKILNNMIKRNEINAHISLFLLKITIIILSYYPEKRHIIYKFYITLYNSKLESKKILLNNINKMNIDNEYTDDLLIDKMIFNTLSLLENCDYNGLGGINLFIIIINEIILNINKIKLDDNELKNKIYLMFIRKSNKFVVEYKVKESVYLKVMEVCGVTIKLINNYIK